ncbi:hemerythrin domain-containing protein [Phenylobacterium sp.]|uniref:hemerythrin domain-containing protein n=1 Tax=Phenylobacterium sp. TaxID=1871053 RepID=UPI0025D330A6|nr:hemerythrin domain-containing protein [Phenylobacterium sp.]
MLDDTRPASAGQAADPPAIRCALMSASAGPPRAPDANAAGLIELILARYHETHRREFPEAITLARKVEAVHADAPGCPHGLADHLALMLDDLESHQQREEQVLFPMILAGGSPMIRFPIGRMMAEHEDVEVQLRDLRALTGDFACPADACGTWRALNALCRKLDADLREHMRLENELLFAPFLT